MGVQPLRVLVVGQTPPPYGGQAIMIERLLAGATQRVHYHHVRLAFSEDMESVGKFQLGKVLVLFSTIARIFIARFRFHTPVLYYPPSGPNMVPVLRDLILLCATRWLFRRTVFHFHASGVSLFKERLPRVLRPLFVWAYGHPALAIRTAAQNPDDGALLGASNSIVVPNGLPDMRGTVPERSAPLHGPFTVLFTGVLVPSKGVLVLLEAFRSIRDRGVDVRLEVMGKWGDADFKRTCEKFVAQHGLSDHVRFLGVKKDTEKNLHFASCDVFCFPSYFEAESFGLVVAEAMQFAKPVVSTRWRGIPSVVEDGTSGFLVPILDPVAVADRLFLLLGDAPLRQRMGEAGRCIFEERFTLQRFHQRMEEAFLGLHL